MPEVPLQWNFFHKGLNIAVHETTDHHVWLCLSDIRKFIPLLKSDETFQKSPKYEIKQVDTTKRWYISEVALSNELKKIGSIDALQLAERLEREVFYAARRKRELVVTLYEEVEQDEIRGATSKSGVNESDNLQTISQPSWVHQFWQGQRGVTETFFAGLVLVTCVCAISMRLISHLDQYDNYQGDFVLRQWEIVTVLFFTVIAPLWWCVSLMRCGLRYLHEYRNPWLAAVSFVVGLTIALRLLTLVISTAGEWIYGWMDNILSRNNIIQTIHDANLGRLVLKGQIGFGSYKVLQKALEENPKLPLVQIESPGGYVIEAMAMARLLSEANIDTVSLENCASACTLLLAAGNDRYIGQSAQIGFHHSWAYGTSSTSEWGPTEYSMAEYFKARGVDDTFIKTAFDTPADKLWTPSVEIMLEAGFASNSWSARKSGY